MHINNHVNMKELLGLIELFLSILINSNSVLKKSLSSKVSYVNLATLLLI